MNVIKKIFLDDFLLFKFSFFKPFVKCFCLFLSLVNLHVYEIARVNSTFTLMQLRVVSSSTALRLNTSLTDTFSACWFSLAFPSASKLKD